MFGKLDKKEFRAVMTRLANQLGLEYDSSTYRGGWGKDEVAYSWSLGKALERAEERAIAAEQHVRSVERDLLLLLDHLGLSIVTLHGKEIRKIEKYSSKKGEK